MLHTGNAAHAKCSAHFAARPNDEGVKPGRGVRVIFSQPMIDERLYAQFVGNLNAGIDRGVVMAAQGLLQPYEYIFAVGFDGGVVQTRRPPGQFVVQKFNRESAHDGTFVIGN